MKDNKKEEKILYSCESELDSYEYKRMAKYFPQLYWPYVLWGTIINFVLSATIAILTLNTTNTLVFFTVYQVSLMLIYKFRIEDLAEKSFNYAQKKGRVDTNIHTEFYEDYFIRETETTTYKINYSDIERCIETDTNFYLKNKIKNMIIIIQKNRCSLELISFIRDKFSDLENQLGDPIKFKETKKYDKPRLIQGGMLLLFILTIATIWISLYSTTLINKIIPQHGFDFVKNMWILWCWLPIPILSIILGFKYKRAGFKCTKNIVAGIIVSFILLIYGAFCLFPTFSEDYKQIDAYRNIIAANLPENGDLEIQDWGTYFDEDKTEYTIINAYYDNENVESLEKSIENNEKWILSEKIKSQLKIFIPSTLFSDKDAYYSIYNKTTNEYNTIPENSGDYEIYAMKYDKSNKCLEIHKFKYSYEK